MPIITHSCEPWRDNNDGIFGRQLFLGEVFVFTRFFATRKNEQEAGERWGLSFTCGLSRQFHSKFTWMENSYAIVEYINTARDLIIPVCPGSFYLLELMSGNCTSFWKMIYDDEKAEGWTSIFGISGVY